MYCPTKDDALAALLALLPRGRAWQNNEGGPEPYRYAPYDGHTFDPVVFDADSRPGAVLYRFWEAVAYVVTFANQRLCALALEMFCATQTETHDQWMIEYGLPDDCDPFPDLCTKVAAVGGTRCEYYAGIAARMGWLIDCLEENVRCAGALAGRALAGCVAAAGGAPPRATLVILVYLNESPAYVAKQGRLPLAGRLRAGQLLTCPPPVNITPLKCLLDRVVHAHMAIEYRTVS